MTNKIKQKMCEICSVPLFKENKRSGFCYEHRIVVNDYYPIIKSNAGKKDITKVSNLRRAIGRRLRNAIEGSDDYFLISKQELREVLALVKQNYYQNANKLKQKSQLTT